MIRAAVISDTHNVLRPDVIGILKKCDSIIHAGDMSKPEILEQLRQIAPVYAVRGNNDKDWAKDLPRELYFTLGDLKVYLIHNKKEVDIQQGKPDIIIFGHSHKYLEEEIDGVLWLNPGSCGRRRFDLPVTMAVLKITGENYRIEKINFPVLGN